MGKLTYSIYYTPNNKKSDFEDSNYVCSDKKVHIRFSDYNSEQIIAGFEKKLTYLFTYLINYSYLPNVINQSNIRDLIENFSRMSDILTINNIIMNHISLRDFKGFKVRANYKKKDCKPFGEITPEVFPVEWIDDTAVKGSLDIFLSKLKISLDDYLFNDSYVIIIREDKYINFNKKFINKLNRKSERKKAKDFDLVELW